MYCAYTKQAETAEMPVFSSLGACPGIALAPVYPSGYDRPLHFIQRTEEFDNWLAKLKDLLDEWS
jgi:hypothetical protein